MDVAPGGQAPAPPGAAGPGAGGGGGAPQVFAVTFSPAAEAGPPPTGAVPPLPAPGPLDVKMEDVVGAPEAVEGLPGGGGGGGDADDVPPLPLPSQGDDPDAPLPSG